MNKFEINVWKYLDKKEFGFVLKTTMNSTRLTLIARSFGVELPMEVHKKIMAGTVEKLLKPENKDQLVKVLTYHVVPGKVLAKDVVKLNKAKTVEKLPLVDGGVNSKLIKKIDCEKIVSGAAVLKSEKPIIEIMKLQTVSRYEIT